VVELVVHLFERLVGAFQVHGLGLHFAVEVFVLAFEQYVLFLDGFLGFAELGVHAFDGAVGALQHQDEEEGHHGDNGYGEVEVALLFDHKLVGGDGGDVFAFSKFGLNFGNIGNQLFIVYTIVQFNVLVLIQRRFFKIFGLVVNDIKLTINPYQNLLI